MALVAEREAEAGGREILGVGRLSRRSRPFQAPGMPSFRCWSATGGKERASAMSFSRASSRSRSGRSIGSIFADILTANLRMQRLCAGLGFTIQEFPGDDVVRAERRI